MDPITLLFIFTIVSVIVCATIMLIRVYFNAKITFRCIIVRDINGFSRRVGMRTSDKDGHIKYSKNVSILLDLNLPLYSRANRIFYMYDISRNVQIKKSDSEGKMNVSVLDILLKGKVIPQLVVRAGKTGVFDASIIGLIIMLAFGVFVGLFIGSMIL